MRAVLAALCSAGISAASALGIAAPEYRALRDTIAADHRRASAACNVEAGNAKDICLAKANGRRDIAVAELEQRKRPGSKATYNVSVAKAKAAYAVARERCDNLSFGDSKACQIDIRATEASALSEAKAARNSR